MHEDVDPDDEAVDVHRPRRGRWRPLLVGLMTPDVARGLLRRRLD